MDAATIHARRWWTLAVMCLSLMVIGMDGMGVGVLVAAGVALLGSVIALLFLPSRARMESDAPAEVEPDLEVVIA